MRFFLFPRAQAGHGRSLRQASAPTTNRPTLHAPSARAEVADYEAQLAAVKAEAAAKVDAARQTLEAERQEQVKALNAQLAERRAAAQAETDAAKAAVRDQIHAAVADVAGRAGELATGRRPDAIGGRPSRQRGDGTMSVLGTIIRPMAECGIDSNGDCVTHSPILPETPRSSGAVSPR